MPYRRRRPNPCKCGSKVWELIREGNEKMYYQCHKNTCSHHVLIKPGHSRMKINPRQLILQLEK